MIGRVLKPWGVKGEVKVEILTDFGERFSSLREVYLDESFVTVESSRLYKGKALLKFPGCDDRESAKELCGRYVQIPIEEAMPLGEDEYYVYQIVGLKVVTTEGESLGEIKEVLFTGSNEVYVVQGEGREVLIPAIADVVKEVDLEGGRLVVTLLEGLI